MNQRNRLIGVLPWAGLIFLAIITVTFASEKAPSKSQSKKDPATLMATNPDEKRADYPGLVPLSGYSTEKARALAKKHQRQLVQLLKKLTREYPDREMEIAALGFLRSPEGGKKDRRYLSVIMEVGQEYDPARSSFEDRAALVFRKYVGSVGKVMSGCESVLQDQDVEGVAISPNWMLKGVRKTSKRSELSEGMHVCFGKKASRALVEDKLTSAQLSALAGIYGRQGDKIKKLARLPIGN